LIASFIRAVTPYGRIGARTRLALVVVELALLLIVWSMVVPVSAKFPTPVEIWQRLGYQIDHGLLFELGVSMKLNLEAIALSSILSLGLAYLFVWPPMRPFANAIAGLRFSGLVGWSFVFYLLIRDGHAIKVAVLVFGMTPYLTTSLLAMVKGIDDEEFQHARTLRLGHLGTTWQVIVRGRLDHAIEAIRQNAAIGWMMVATVEGMLRTEGGIGVRLMEQQKYLKLDDVFAIILVILVVGVLQDFLIRWIRNLVCPYASLTTRSI